ncbi:hypothetical protein INT47_006535, partial [Mucor saturninus]
LPRCIIKCVLVIGEFKKSIHYSAIESDTIKLGKQMRLTYNELVINRVPNPAVCGILCQGIDLVNYVMDLRSPQLYAMIRTSRVSLLRSLDEIYSLPRVISCIAQLKNIALETAIKAESSIVNALDRSTKPPSAPQRHGSLRIV